MYVIKFCITHYKKIELDISIPNVERYKEYIKKDESISKFNIDWNFYDIFKIDDVYEIKFNKLGEIINFIDNEKDEHIVKTFVFSECILKRNLYLTQYILDYNPQLLDIEYNGWNVLHHLVSINDMQLLRIFLKNIYFSSMINIPCKNKTLLFLSVEKGLYVTTRFLLEKGAQDVSYYTHYTSIIQSIKNNDLTILNLLLDNYVENFYDIDLYYILLKIIKEQELDKSIVKIILTRKIYNKRYFSDYEEFINTMISVEKWDVIFIFLNLVDDIPYDVLYIIALNAIKDNKIDVIKFLYISNKSNKIKNKILRMSCKFDKTNIVSLILEKYDEKINKKCLEELYNYVCLLNLVNMISFLNKYIKSLE